MTSRFSSPSSLPPEQKPEGPDKAPAARREKLTPARVEDLRERIEGTSLSYKRIAQETGISIATISRYVAQEGWQRPPGAAVPARAINNHRERVTQKLWKLTERHAEALESMPVELAQRSLQPLARLTRVLGDIEKHNPPAPPPREELEPEPESNRTLHELRDELQAHLDRIMREEGYGWEVREWWFESGGGI